VVKIDPKLQPADVAALADAGLTAYHAVRKAVPLLYPGTTCVVIGAGGLGHIGIQCLLAMTAAHVVVVDPSEAARDLARQLGAHEVTDRTEELRDTAHVVLDFVGEQGAEREGLAMTRRAGSYFVIGYGGSVDIPTIDLISTERNIVGNLVGSYNDLDELMTLAAQGRVTLHTRTYPLAAVNEAMDDLELGRLRGRGILIPDRVVP
jgi:NAD+-dependent secondary alcohol dehydrogenase Adh1